MWRKTILYEGLKVQVSFLVDLKIFFFYYPFSWNEKYKWHIIYTFYCYKFEIVMIWLIVQVKLKKIFRSKRWPNNIDWQMMQSNANEIFSRAIFLCFEHRGVILMQCFIPLTSCMFSISHVFTYLNGRLSILEHLNCHSVVLMMICHIYMKWCLLLLKVSSEEQTIDDLIKKN